MKYSAAPHYVAVNRAAVKEMFRQVGNLLCDDHGIAQRGLIIRHLVLPNGLSGTDGTMKFLSEELSQEAWTSLMGQYFPAYRAHRFNELSRRITGGEYGEAFRTMVDHGIENGWVQEHDAIDSDRVDH